MSIISTKALRFGALRFGITAMLLASPTAVWAQRQLPAEPTASTSSQASSKDQPQEFSGPQVGEKILPFKVQGVFDQAAGQEIDFVAQANGKPLVLIFVHDVNRQSISFTRVLSTYTLGRKPEELATGIVWLSDDATEAESTLKRVRHALGPQVASGSAEEKKGADEKKEERKLSTDAAAILKLLPSAIGVSPEGREGPGSYGLNRKMTLTILVAKDNKVEANFALVQPSLQADLPKVLESIVKVAGGKIPKLEELDGMPAMARQPATDGQAPNLRPLLQPLIRLSASEEDVDKAALAIEKQANENPATRREVIRIATTIINAGKLENYGTPRCQEYLTKWAKEKFDSEK